MAQKDGCYPRVNGTMLQSLQYDGMIVSLVGKLIGPGHFQASDGTNVSLSMDFLEGYHFNPDMAVEIIIIKTDCAGGATFVTNEYNGIAIKRIKIANNSIINKPIVGMKKFSYCFFQKNPAKAVEVK